MYGGVAWNGDYATLDLTLTIRTLDIPLTFAYYAAPLTHYQNTLVKEGKYQKKHSNWHRNNQLTVSDICHTLIIMSVKNT